MPDKLLLSWNSHPAHEREIISHVSELVNRVSPLGLELRDAWYTAYGEAEQILVSGTTETRDHMEYVLRSKDWTRLRERLEELVSNFNQKIIPAKGGFQI